MIKIKSKYATFSITYEYHELLKMLNFLSLPQLKTEMLAMGG